MFSKSKLNPSAKLNIISVDLLLLEFCRLDDDGQSALLPFSASDLGCALKYNKQRTPMGYLVLLSQLQLKLLKPLDI